MSEDLDTISGPDEDTEARAHNVLKGVEGLTSLSEAAAIMADIEAVEVIAELLDGILTVVAKALGIWEALEAPHRTLGYQGYAYGLLRACAGMPDPTPNPGWPDLADVNNDYSDFEEPVAKAKTDAQNTKLRNQILLAMAKFGPQKILKDLWDKTVSDDDHLFADVYAVMARCSSRLSSFAVPASANRRLGARGISRTRRYYASHSFALLASSCPNLLIPTQR